MDPVLKDIQKTLAYFSFFKYPLTVFEIFKWQYQPSKIRSYAEIQEALSSRPSHHGMHGLCTEDEIKTWALDRHRRYRNALYKERKLRKFMHYLRRVESIEGIAICNSMAYHATRPESDIDLFIITKPGKIWTTRFLSVAPLIITRQRPGEAKIDPIDTSFFITSNALNLEDIKKQNDPYMAFWIKTLMPIAGSSDLWTAFHAQNKWADACLPNAPRVTRPKAKYFTLKPRIGIAAAEPFLRHLQEKKFPQDIKTLAGQSSNVVISNTRLKFHKNDRREEIATHMQSIINSA